jgi:hypothetical protein
MKVRVVEANFFKDKHRMNPREKFLRHAADCERMAESASELTWKQMAERWRHCASKTEAGQHSTARIGASDPPGGTAVS